MNLALQVWLPLNGNTKNCGLNGTSVGGSPASWGTGICGKCATFTGSNVITINDKSAFSYTDNFSWTIWINTAYSGSGARYLFSVGRVDMGSYGYGLQINNTTTCTVWFGNRTYGISVAGGTWTHVAFTKSGTTIKIYINGTLKTTTTFDGTAPTYTEGNGLGIGSFHYSGGDIYYGQFSANDFRLYDNALTPKEIHDISLGLVCHYPLNDSKSLSSGVCYDTSGFSNHGTISSTKPTVSSDSIRYDGCYVFDGKSTFITTPQTAKITISFTCNIWAYSTAWSSSGNFVSCTEGGGWNIEHNNGYINFPVYANGAYRSCTSSTTWASLSSGWHMFTISYDGKVLKLYLDGKLNKSLTAFTDKAYPVTYNSSNTIFIGAEAGNNSTSPAGSYFAGNISDFRLYTTALSDADVSQLYNTPITITSNGTMIVHGEVIEEVEDS